MRKWEQFLNVCIYFFPYRLLLSVETIDKQVIIENSKTKEPLLEIEKSDNPEIIDLKRKA